MESYTLVERAAVVVAASFWCHENVIESSYERSESYWMETKVKVKKNIHTLDMPTPCKQKVEDFIVFVDKDIKKWMHDHDFLTISGSVLSSLFCWSPEGVIDGIATAKKVLSLEKNIINCFRIACMYCLENDIFKLWDLMEHQNLSDNSDVMKYFEVKFWVSYIKDNMNDLMDEMEYTDTRDTLCFAVSISVRNNNAVWTEHFLRKMEKDQMCTVAYNKLHDILDVPDSFPENIKYNMIPLLSRYVSSEMFDDLTIIYSETILLYFSKFPTLHNFLKIANKSWDVLQEEAFYLILDKMACHLQEYEGNSIFMNAVELFWKNSPDHFKIYIIENSYTFLIKLSELEHTFAIITLIFKSSTSDQAKDMLFSYEGIALYDALIRNDRLSCFSEFVQELIGSESREDWIKQMRHLSQYQNYIESYRAT